MYKSYKIRLYPTKEQEELLWKHIHACRFIWNYMLAYQEECYKNGILLNAYDLIKVLTPLKKQQEYMWLNEVSNHSLQYVCKNLNHTYKMFFKGIRNHPKFKSRKKSKKSFLVREDRIHFNNDKTVTITKLSKIKIKGFYNNPSKIIKPCISYINKKWILSFITECENQTPILTDNSMGIDLGIKELAVVSYDNKKIVFHNINKSKRIRTLEHKLKHIQRIINRKYRTNGNYEKTNNILKYEFIENCIHFKLMNIRHNYIHQTTHKLVSFLPRIVVMEKLNILSMMKNKHISKYLSEQGLYEFMRQMKYKCEWNGIKFIQVDRYYPSSRICSCCGNIKKDLKLSDRTYNCLICGLSIDRDYNAAINLMKYASHDKRLTA